MQMKHGLIRILLTFCPETIIYPEARTMALFCYDIATGENNVFQRVDRVT